MVERGNKKGLSTIVATLLVILLAIVAIAIIWVVVRNVLQENSDQVSLGKFTVDMEISKADKINYSYISATVKRNPGKGEVSGIIFIASDKDNSEIIKYNISMKELEQRNFQLILYVINTSAVEKISIVPIFMRDSGKELIGNIADEWIFNLSKSGIGEIICTDTCLSLGYECGIQTVCEVVNTDCGPCSSGTCNPAGQCVVIRNLAWEPNSTINSSLLYIGSWSAPTVFYKDGSWYLIAGEHDGRFFGFKLNGNNWESDPAIVSGLPNIGLKSYPAVFYKDSSWYLISGDYYGNFYGFAWNGNQWVTNLTINASLPDIGSYSRLSVFYKDSDWYLISGEDNGNFYGFVYT